MWFRFRKHPQIDPNPVVRELDKLLKDPQRREIHFCDRGAADHTAVEDFHQAAYSSSFEEDFVKNWYNYLLEKARELASIGEVGEAEAFELACTAYDTAAATEQALREKFMMQGRIVLGSEVPRVLPPSSFRDDLGFDDLDYKILHGSFQRPPYQTGFYILKRVEDCVEFVFEDARKRRELSRP